MIAWVTGTQHSAQLLHEFWPSSLCSKQSIGPSPQHPQNTFRKTALTNDFVRSRKVFWVKTGQKGNYYYLKFNWKSCPSSSMWLIRAAGFLFNCQLFLPESAICTNMFLNSFTPYFTVFIWAKIEQITGLEGGKTFYDFSLLCINIFNHFVICLS